MSNIKRFNFHRARMANHETSEPDQSEQNDLMKECEQITLIRLLRWSLQQNPRRTN